MTRPVGLLLALVALSCGVPGRHVRTGPELPGKDRFCEVRTYPAGQRPARFTIVGNVEAEAPDEASALARLQAHACFLGADGLVGLESRTVVKLREQRVEGGDWKPVPVGQEVQAKAVAVLVLEDVAPPPRPPPPKPPSRMPVVAPVPPPAPPVVAPSPVDAGPGGPPDAGSVDAGSRDPGGKPDAGAADRRRPDAGPGSVSRPDAGVSAAFDDFALPPLD